MGYTPVKRLTRDEVEEMAKAPEGSVARLALLESNLYDGRAAFYMQAGILKVVPLKENTE